MLRLAQGIFGSFNQSSRSTNTIRIRDAPGGLQPPEWPHFATLTCHEHNTYNRIVAGELHDPIGRYTIIEKIVAASIADVSPLPQPEHLERCTLVAPTVQYRQI